MNFVTPIGNNRGTWHYINWPFKPEGQPASVQANEPDRVNILTAMAENEEAVKKENNIERRAIARVAVPSRGRHTPALTHGTVIHC